MSEARARRTVRTILFVMTMGASFFLAGIIATSLLTRRARPMFAEPAPPGFVDVRLHASDGESIGAWLASDPGDDVAVVIAHGNGSSRGALLDEAQDLRSRGCTVMPISLRAHGDSTGERNDIGWSARHDIAAAVDYLREQAPDRPVVVMGTSLGAAAAVFAGAREHIDADGYVLVGIFADLRTAVRRRTQRYLPPGIELLAYESMQTAAPFVFPDLDFIAPAEWADRLPSGTRALFLVGGDDTRAPIKDALAVAAHIDQARIVVLPGLDHEDLEQVVERSEWSEAIDLLLSAVRAEASVGSTLAAAQSESRMP